MKKLAKIYSAPGGHWVGDGFPVRTMFSYNKDAADFSPFLLLDYAGPTNFPPSSQRRGVGQHPHRGFETVSIIYQGEVEHRDSAGNHGRIGPGDVQWMTAAKGILHEEFHGGAFTKSGGMLEMVQLWVNLPARDKMTAPQYQEILDATIPVVKFGDEGGFARVIAGEFNGVKGPAHTFIPVNLCDLRLNVGSTVEIAVPDGFTTLALVQSGNVRISGGASAGAAQLAQFERHGEGVTLHAQQDSKLLLMSGQPIEEPIVGQGPFVMNTREEIGQAIADFNAGRF